MRKPKTKREIYKTAISQLGRKILKDEKIDENGHDNTGFFGLIPKPHKNIPEDKIIKTYRNEFKKEEVIKFVEEFCDICRYVKKSDIDYANDFFIKPAFVQSNTKFRNNKELLFLLTCEYGVLFEGDFDIYADEKFKDYFLNCKHISKAQNSSIKIEYTTVKDLFKNVVNELYVDYKSNYINKYVPYIYDIMCSHKSPNRDNEPEFKFKNNEDKNRFYNTVIPQIIRKWSILNVSESYYEYERDIEVIHYGLMKLSQKRIINLKAVWQDALKWVQKIKFNNKDEIYNVSMDEEDLKTFLETYIRPDFKSKLNIKDYIGKNFNKLSSVPSVNESNLEKIRCLYGGKLTTLYYHLCEKLRINKNSIDDRLKVWFYICEYFVKKDDYNKFYNHSCMACIWQCIGINPKTFNWELYQDMQKWDKIGEFTNNIPIIKLLNTISQNLDESMPFEIANLSFKDPTFANSTFMDEYVRTQDFKKLVEAVSSYKDTINVYETLWQYPIFTRDYRKAYLQEQFSKTCKKNLIHIGDDFIKQIRSYRGYNDNSITNAKNMIFECAIQENIRLKAKQKLFN